MDVETKSRAIKCCWRSFYVKLTETNISIPDESIKSDLSSYWEAFKYGFTNYDSPVDYWNEALKKRESIPHDMEAFFLQLIKVLQLDAAHCVAIFSNYINYGYQHSSVPLKELVHEDPVSVLLSVWTFFSREKLFHLKCFQYIIVNSTNPEHMYNAVFKQFLEDISLDEVYTNIVERFNHIIRFPLPSYSSHGEVADLLLPQWDDYNLKEQLHLLELMVLITEFVGFKFKYLKNHFELLRATQFGTLQHYGYYESSGSKRTQRMICYLMNFHVIQLMKFGWSSDIYEENDTIFREHNRLVNAAEYRPERGPLIAAWTLMRCYVLLEKNGLSKKDVALEYGHCIVDLWSFLLELITSDLFQENPKLFLLASNITNEMITLSLDYREMGMFANQKTLISLVSCMAKQSGLQNMPESVQRVWDLCSDTFPCNLSYFLQITRCLLESDNTTSGENMINRILKLKYSTDNTENMQTVSALNKYVLSNVYRPLLYYPDVIINAGTEVEFNYETGIAKFNYIIPVWKIISNCMKRYSAQKKLTEQVDNELRDDILECIKFCAVVLRKDAHYINDMIECVEDTLNLIQTITRNFDFCSVSSEPLENLDPVVLSSCMNLSISLLDILPEDILRFYSGLNFLPQNTKCNLPVNFSTGYHKVSVLWSIIEFEERKFGTFGVLLSYLKLLRYLVSSNGRAEDWYIVGGIGLIFDLFAKVENNTWSSKEKDFNLVLWYCSETLNDVLMCGVRSLFDTNESSQMKDFVERHGRQVPTIYFLTKHCVNLLLTSEEHRTISKIASMGETGLFARMEDYVLWTSGSSAVLLNTVYSSLSVLYRAFIFTNTLAERKVEILKLERDTILGTCNMRSVLSYTNNCFSYSLKVLSLQLLSLLADQDSECVSFGLNLPSKILRTEFLQPLGSSEVTNEYKVLLISFASKCILKQKIIAKELIDVEDVMKSIKNASRIKHREKIVRELITKNSLFSIALHYLFNISTISTEESKSDIHCAVLKLLHTVWHSDLFHLRLFFTVAPTFWKELCKPLLRKPSESYIGYSLILDIVKLEIQKSEKLDAALDKILNSLLNTDWLSTWMVHSITCVNKPDTMVNIFKSVSLQPSAFSKSWQEFLLVVSKRMKSSKIEIPGKSSLIVLKELTQDVVSLNATKRTVYLSDMYFLLLSTWSTNCNSDWKEEVNLACEILSKLPEFVSRYPAAFPVCNSLLLICFKIFTYGKQNLSKVLEQKEEGIGVMQKCLTFLVDNINGSHMLLLRDGATVTISLCISLLTTIVLTDADTRMYNLVLRRLKYVNVFNNLPFVFDMNLNENIFIVVNIMIKFIHTMIMQSENHDNGVLDTEQILLVLLYRTVPPYSLLTLLQKYASGSDKTDHVSVKWFQIYSDILNIILLLLAKVTTEIKEKAFKLLYKQFELWHCIFSLNKIHADENHLNLTTSCVSILKFVVEHNALCSMKDKPLLTRLCVTLRTYILSTIQYLLYPSKICCFLLGVEITTQLEESLPTKELQEIDVCKIKRIYNKMLNVTKLGISVLVRFTVDPELIYNSLWFDEIITHNSADLINAKRFPCVLPTLQWDDILQLTTFVDQSYSAVYQEKSEENMYDTMMKNTPKVLYIDSKSSLVSFASFYFAEIASIFLNHDIHPKEKQILATQLNLYMREFLGTNFSSSYTSVKTILQRRQSNLLKSRNAAVRRQCELHLKEHIVQITPNVCFQLVRTPQSDQASLYPVLPPEPTIDVSETGTEDSENILNDTIIYLISRYICKLLLTHKYD